MINLLLFVFAITCFGLVAAWLAQNPGDVTIYWFDWRIDTSMAFLLTAIIAAGIAAAVLYLFIRAIVKGPGVLSTRSQLKSHKKAIAALTYGVASLAAGDTRGAAQHTKKAEKLLGKSPITLLLAAQVARHQNDEEETRRLLEQLLDFKETEYLAARNLSESASKQKMLPRALALAKRAQSVNPRDASAVRATISLQLKLEQWDEAISTVHKHAGRTELSRAAIRRMEGIAHMMHAKALLATRNSEAALMYAKKAYKYIPGFVPAALLTSDCYHALGQTDKSMRVLKSAWKVSQHPHIAEKIKERAAGEHKKYAKLLKDVAQRRGGATPLYQCSHCGHSQPDFSVYCPACDAFDTQL